MRHLATTFFTAAALTVASSLPAAAAQLPQPGAASAQTLKMPSGPGSVRGLAQDPTVSTFTGQMAYQVPIDVPAGPAGFKPELSLQYQGGLGNGALGVGWTLGFPGIVRSTRLGVPHYDDTDELELGGVARGGRLVRLTDGTYRVMGAGQFVKVVAKTGGFEATDGEGRVHAFGTSASSRIESGGKVAAWLPERITDVAGQKVVFGYTRLENELYLSSLTWGPGDVFRVELAYGARPDPVISYRTGFRVRTARRLTEIRVQVKVNGQYALRSKYALAYDDLLPLSRLAQVTRLGTDGVTAWPATSFTYARPESPDAFELTGTEGWVLGQGGVSLLDVDGDGVSDLLKMADGAHAWRRNRGGTFASARSLAHGQTSDLFSARIMDLDGDAKPELVRLGPGTWSAQRLRGETWDPSFTWPGTTNLPLQDPSGATSWVDIDGDNRIDVVKPLGSGLAFYKNGPNGYAAMVQTGPISSSNPGLAPGQNGVRFFDANGDGLEDVLWLAPGGLQVFLGRGDATFEERPIVAYPFTGAVELANLHLADLNRDGIVDLVRVTGTQVELYYGRGEGFDTSARRLTQPVSNVLTVTVADANGNGSQDLIWCSSTKMYALDLAGTSEAGMLTGIDNGLGKRIQVGYEASGVLATSAELAGSPWVQKLPASIPVVTSTATSPGAGEPERRTEYVVRDAFWDAAERRFGGYLEGKTITDPGGPGERIELVKYHAGLGTLRVLRGRPLTSSVVVGGRLVEATENKWEVGTIAGITAAVTAQEPLLRFARQSKETVVHYEGVVTPVQTLIERTYDGEGRVTEEKNYGRTDLTGDEIIVRRTYASDDSTWVRDRVVTEAVYAGDETLVSEKQLQYGDQSAILPLGQVGRGWLRAEKQHLVYAGTTPPTNRWVLTRTATYDASGNLTGGLQDGVLHKVEYDARGLYPLRETTSPAAGRTLEWKETWDETLGQVATFTEPAGARVTITYDALGRPVSMARDAQLPHLFYEYDWRAPRPETTTWEFMGPVDAVTARPGLWSADGGWRRRVEATNGSGDEVLRATQVGAGRWIVDVMRVRNARGLTVERAVPFYFDGERPPESVPAATPRERIDYDALGRATDQTSPDGARRHHDYTAVGRTTSVDGQAAMTSLFDGQRRIVRSERVVDGKLESVDATYDAAGRILALAIAGGAVTHRFTYDTLGRLRVAQDPDLGARTLDYDDAGRLVKSRNAAGQWMTVTWDGVGRVREASTSEGSRFVFHFDEAHPQLAALRVQGRLGWVEEPDGYTAFSYALGGEREVVRRSVLGKLMVERSRYAANGAPLGVSYDDGLELAYDYDPAGRLEGIGDYWHASALDAGGRVERERFGNGAEATYEHDVAGQVLGIRLTSGGRVRLDLGLTRTPFGAIDTVTDRDDAGLSHSADFDYDAGGRLTWAQIGSGADAFQFGYAYDVLDNLIQRDASGPRSLGLLTGTYRYGENGAGPRQLTSVDGAHPARFAYDAAGRQIEGDGARLAFNVLDQLVRVEGRGAGPITYGYGYDGQRTSAQGPDGTRLWFGPNTTQEGDLREHYLLVGDRVVAKVRRSLGAASVASAAHVAGLIVLMGALGLLAALLVRAASRAPRRRLRIASVLTLGAQLVACGGGPLSLGESRSALVAAETVHYFHTGVAAGPAIITRADGSVAEERRFEPFGQAIDAWREESGRGSVDFGFEPFNGLNKPTDPTTGWSYHGARWMAPETGRWFSPDPLVKAPDPAFLASPWRLNPYSYGDQNPVRFWDPDGKQSVPVDGEKAVDKEEKGFRGSFDLGKIEHGPGMVEQRPKGSIEIGYLRGENGKMEYRLKVDLKLMEVTTAPWSKGAFGPIGFEWSLGSLESEIAFGGGRTRAQFGGSAVAATLVIGKLTPHGRLPDLTLRVGGGLGPGTGRGITLFDGSNDEDHDGLAEHGIKVEGFGVDLDLEIKTEIFSQAYVTYQQAQRYYHAIFGR